jgi:hypothetical protein
MNDSKSEPIASGKEVHVIYYGYGSPEGYSAPIAAFDSEAAAALHIFKSNSWWKDGANIRTLIINEPRKEDTP